MKTVKRIIALLLVLVMTAGLVACGGGMEPPAEAGDRTIVYYAASYVTAQVQPYYQEMVKAYNDGQGKTDGVYVQMRENSGAISGLDSALRGNYQYDVLQLRDDEYKTLAMQGGNYFVELDKYLTDDVKTAMQYDQIPAALVNRFRMNTKPAEGGKFLAGEGASLLAIPNGSDPQILFYNKTILNNCGINVISVPESELEAYNTANSATLQPHGYAEYKQAPYADAISSKNEAGEFVYKVFNECIGMSWEEQRCLVEWLSWWPLAWHGKPFANNSHLICSHASIYGTSQGCRGMLSFPLALTGISCSPKIKPPPHV